MDNRDTGNIWHKKTTDGTIKNG